MNEMTVVYRALLLTPPLEVIIRGSKIYAQRGCWIIIII